MATGILKKWGNSQGIIIPKDYCKRLGIIPGDRFNLVIYGETLIIKPERDSTLTSLLNGYDGPPPTEYNWGKPVGKEMW